MLPRGLDFDQLRAGFQWRIPTRYNIGVDACDKWADGSGRLALLHLRQDGGTERISFDALKAASNRLANVLRAHGVQRGERLGVLLPQVPEAAVAHLAIYKLGGIAVPLFQLFGDQAIEYRLRNCGAAALVTDAVGLEKLAGIRANLGDLRLVLKTDGPGEGALDLAGEMARASDSFVPEDTAADDPALIIYTSGTTGSPKGALHAHRVLLGHLPGVELPQDLFPQPGDLFWTPADWAWIGGLLDVLLPSLHHGVPVLAHRMAKFDPEFALRLMAQHGVRNAFIPPTALKMLRGVPQPARFGARPRSIGSGGETLGAELLDWGRETFGCTINEFYGQTECNLIVSSCGALMPSRPGWMGKAVPGHEVAVLDAQGQPQPPGTLGTIAVRRPDPVMFLGYWNNPEATAAKFVGDWLLTGDQGTQDEAGWFRFVGRDDDVITSAGYRIGPGEIEDCLLRHPAVALAAVIGLPDPLRTEAVTAVIVPAPGAEPGPALAAEIQALVRSRLAAHAYPRQVYFMDALPQTATGKVMRGELRRRLSERKQNDAE
jgi:acetyl-CoA synthetase